MTKSAARERGFEKSMLQALGANPQDVIANDEFTLCAQEITALHPATRPLRMQALLVRTRGAGRNLAPTFGFLPADGQAGTMPIVDRIVVRRALAACAVADPARRGGPPVQCMRLSAATLRDLSFVDFVDDALERCGVCGETLCFEIEETDSFALGASGARTVQALRQLGCRISLDGFGATGVAFDDVGALPLDFVKIDGRIVRQIRTDPIALDVIHAILRASKAIGVRSIAQSVEDHVTLGLLASAGVHYAQGPAIAAERPVSLPV